MGFVHFLVTLMLTAVILCCVAVIAAF